MDRKMKMNTLELSVRRALYYESLNQWTKVEVDQELVFECQKFFTSFCQTFSHFNRYVSN